MGRLSAFWYSVCGRSVCAVSNTSRRSLLGLWLWLGLGLGLCLGLGLGLGLGLAGRDGHLVCRRSLEERNLVSSGSE